MLLVLRSYSVALRCHRDFIELDRYRNSRSPINRIGCRVTFKLELTNDIAVIGHTDAVPFGNDDYSNWELSADRANAARRLLTRHGLLEERIVRVTGKAAVEPLVADRTAPQNRRIAITLLRNSRHVPGRNFGRNPGPNSDLNHGR